MKKRFQLVLAVCMAAACAVCGNAFAGEAQETGGGRQIASAHLDQTSRCVDVTVDLSGGWSVEFASGAFYLYEPDYSEDKDAAAIGLTLEEEVFAEYCAEAEASESYQELDGALFYTDEAGEAYYLIPVGDDAFLMLDVMPGKDSDAVFARVQAERGMDLPDEDEETGEEEAAGWTREGYYSDENENMLSITWMDDIDEPGWYVGCFLGEDFVEDSWGGTLPEEGDTLHGILAPSGSKEELTVTVSEEGEDGLLLEVEGGETYHLTEMDMQDAGIFVTINTEGMGNIEYAEGEEAPEPDPEYPFQSAQINLDEPKTHTFLAWPQAGSLFVKWTKDGEDFSTEPQITLLLDESADYVAVFEEDPDWQNPVMNFVGEYQCDRANALVECFGNDEAWITISWGGSAKETAQWDIVGRLDLDTLTIEYTGCTKSILTYGEDGEVESQEPEYEDGSGTVTFNDDGTFTWHEDQSESGEDMVFEWKPVA